MNRHSSAYTAGFIALETIAIIVVVVLVAVVTIAIVFTPQFSPDGAIKAPVDTLPQRNNDVLDERKDVQFIVKDSPFAPDPEGTQGKPINEKLYDQNVKNFSKLSYTIMETRFKGEILSIDRSNGLRMKMSSLLENSAGVEVDYFIQSEVLSKISVSDGSVDTLAVGDTINIDETNDYSLPYQDSIQVVSISQF